MQLLSHQQRLHLVNTQQLYESYVPAVRHMDSYHYGLRWKKVRGTEYLFRPSNREGAGRSLGRRSPETESVLAAFELGRSAARDRLSGLRAKLEEQARLNKALRLSRVPKVIGRILRHMDEQGLRDSFLVLGTQALYAYEAVAGVQFLLELLASGDYDTRKMMTLVSRKMEGQGLLGLSSVGVCPAAPAAANKPSRQ